MAGRVLRLLLTGLAATAGAAAHAQVPLPVAPASLAAPPPAPGLFHLAALPVEAGIPPGTPSAGIVPAAVSASPARDALRPWPTAVAAAPANALAAIAAVAPLPQPRPPLRPQPNASPRLALASVGAAPLEGLRDGLSEEAAGCPELAALDYAIATPRGPLQGPGSCGTAAAVTLSGVVLADGSRLAIQPAATLSCPMAAAVARWVREDLAPEAVRHGHPLVVLENYASYDCRGRNRDPAALLSEHGRANALDVRGFEEAGGRKWRIGTAEAPPDLLVELKRSACARFMTVLGPGSDGFHEDHVHVDLAPRRNGWTICQWDKIGTAVAGAPLPPRPRQTAALKPVQPRPATPPPGQPLAPVQPRPPGPPPEAR